MHLNIKYWYKLFLKNGLTIVWLRMQSKNKQNVDSWNLV